MNKVAVRIVKRGNTYLVIGRKTTVECKTYEEAWETSIPFFAGKTY